MKPAFPYAYSNRAIARAANNDADGEIADYTQAIRLMPGNALLYLNRGFAYELRKGDYDRAIADADEAIRLQPDLAGAYLMRSDAHKWKKEYELAIADAGEAIRLKPDDIWGYHRRGDAYDKSGDYDRAIADYSEAIRLKPDSAASYTARGWVYNHKGDQDRAIADHERAVRLDPKAATNIVAHAMSRADAGEYAEAIAELNEEIRENPKDFWNYMGRSYVYAKKKDYINAIADRTQVIRLKPEADFADYFNRAAYYFAARDADGAIADIDKALKLKPLAPEYLASAYATRGNAYRNKGDFEHALSDYDEAFRIAPDLARPQGGRCMAYAWQGGLEDALKECDEAIRKDKLYVYYGMRALVYLDLGKHAEAMAEAEAALKLTQKEDFPFEVRGLIFLAMGKPVEAVDDFSEAIRLGSDSLRARVSRGEAYEKLGSKAAALADYRNAIGMAAYSPLQRKARLRATERVAALEAEIPATPLRKVSAAPAGGAGRRVALVIGEGRYEQAPFLPNPPRDAQALADAFRHLGFTKVIELYDAPRAELEQAVREFAVRAADADWAVVFYAGHGIQVDGRNFLIPKDARIGPGADVEKQTVSLDEVMAAAARARTLGLVILNSCRNNPFLNHLREGAKGKHALGDGLASVEPAQGELVAFATRDGQTAEDGDDEPHSPFTAALLKHIDASGLELRVLFGKVHDTVFAATAKGQEPFVYGSGPGEELYFKAE